MCISIEKEGIFNSIQGLGKYGQQRFGINPRGAMDRTAVRIINILLGNPHDLPVIEFHFPAGEIRFIEDCLFAMGGADFAAELDGDPLDIWRTNIAKDGQRLSFKKRVRGSRCYLAVKGGLTSTWSERVAPPDLATIRLVKGDRLSRLYQIGDMNTFRGSVQVSRSLIPAYSRFPTVRFLPGAEFGRLADDSRHSLQGSDFEVSADSNRMGFRLLGPKLSLAEPIELVSASVNFGTMQLLPDGRLVILMADHQTSGGYPRIGNIISADLPLIGQLGPGDKVAFTETTIEEAERIAITLEADLRRLEIGVRFGRYW